MRSGEVAGAWTSATIVPNRRGGHCKIVGTTGGLETLLFKNFPEEYPRIQLTNLQNEYAVLVLPEHLVEPVAALDKIEYMEKPKLLFFAVDNGKRASCITSERELTVGCRCPWRLMIPHDYAHPDFSRRR